VHLLAFVIFSLNSPKYFQLSSSALTSISLFNFPLDPYGVPYPYPVPVPVPAPAPPVFGCKLLKAFT
jgi:hypothetical protein